MLIQGFPFPTKLPGDPAGADRFWYWRGASGRKYIHSVYAWGACPPLPGAVYVAVKRHGSLRIVIAVSRFSPVWDDAFRAFRELDADEVHVHLLARNSAHADTVLADLTSAFAADEELPRHLETKSAWRIAA